VVKVPDNLGTKHLLQQESNNNNNKLQQQRQHQLVGSNRGFCGLVSPTSMVGSQSEVRAVNDAVKTAKPAKAPKERAGSGQTKRWTWKKPGDKVSHTTVSSTNGDIGLSHLTQTLLPVQSLQ
jgi:hypothetical protein